MRELRYSVASSLDDYIAGPVLLGGGVPLIATPSPRLRLRLRSHRLYAATGTLALEYDVTRDESQGPDPAR